MAILTPIVLARLEAAKKMLDTYSTTRASKVSDGGGSYAQGPAVTLTGPCSFSAAGGRTEESPLLQQRGDYRIRVVADADILPTDTLTIFGRKFRVVWTPPVKALAVTRVIGLTEVGGGS